MNMKQGRSWDMAHHPPMPRPKNDDGYFEEMSKGESTSIMFLFGVGEEMPQTLQKMQEMHETTH